MREGRRVRRIEGVPVCLLAFAYFQWVGSTPLEVAGILLGEQSSLGKELKEREVDKHGFGGSVSSMFSGIQQVGLRVPVDSAEDSKKFTRVKYR